jgi:hypothetical protein
MHRASGAIAVGASVLALFSACSSSSSSTMPAAVVDAGPTPSGQPRSFRRDIVPLLAQSCADLDCHGDPANTRVGVHFNTNDPDALYTELQRESPTAKGVKLVAPGDPTQSFLYAKINGDEGNFDSKCGQGGCGETMPPGTKIDSSQRDAMKAWIMDGAAKD